MQQVLQQEQAIRWSVDCLRSRQPTQRIGKCSEEYHSMDFLDELFFQPEWPSQHQELGVIDNCNRRDVSVINCIINTKINISWIQTPSKFELRPSGMCDQIRKTISVEWFNIYFQHTLAIHLA